MHCIQKKEALIIDTAMGTGQLGKRKRKDREKGNVHEEILRSPAFTLFM